MFLALSLYELKSSRVYISCGCVIFDVKLTHLLQAVDKFNWISCIIPGLPDQSLIIQVNVRKCNHNRNHILETSVCIELNCINTIV